LLCYSALGGQLCLSKKSYLGQEWYWFIIDPT
jgi:hypothetical protein